MEASTAEALSNATALRYLGRIVNFQAMGKAPDALAIVKTLRAAGHVAYFAGGCVRDMLLELEPKDFDVATNAPPARVRELFRNTQAVGAAFGVILVRQGKTVVEVATFRTDLKYTDGRRPEGVIFTTAEEDAKRRDFTINGMFFDPIENRVIDYVGGQNDLKSRVLRAIGEPNHRFEEDHLRLLRAIRFAARFELTIESITADAIKRHAQYLKRISPERIAEELRLMLTAPTRRLAHRMLAELGLDHVILRFLRDAREPIGIFQALEGQTIPFGLVLAAMILDARQGVIPTTLEIRKAGAAMRHALKISNDESDVFEGSLAFGHLLENESPSVAQMKRFLAEPTSLCAMELMRALAHCGVLRDRIESRMKRLEESKQTDIAPPPLITGDDLTTAGLRPGPVFKRVLDATYDEQLEGRITTREQAMKFALNLAHDGG